MGVVVSSSDAAVQVAPGSVGVLTLRIRNTGGIVEGFSIEPLGDLAAFTDVNPPLVNVLPGQDGMATVTIRPPRSSQPPAGAYALGLRVRGRQDPASSAVEEVHVTLAPFTALDLRVVPQNAKGRRSATLRAEVANTGNSPAAVRILASDPDDALAMSPAQAVLNLGPGERAVQSIVVRSRDRPFRGQPEQHPFLVTALGADGTGPSFTGQYKQLPVMPSLAVSGGTVAALIAAGAAVFVVTQNNNKKSDASAVVTTVAGQAPVTTVVGEATTVAGADAGANGGGGGAATTMAAAASTGLRTSFLAAPLNVGPDVNLTSGGQAFFVQASGGTTKVPTSAKQVLVSISVIPPDAAVAAGPSTGSAGGSMIAPSKIRNLNQIAQERGIVVGNAAPTTAPASATTGTLVAGPNGGDARVVMTYSTDQPSSVLTTLEVPADGGLVFAAANGSASARFRISVVGWLSADGSGGPALVPTARVANAMAVPGGSSVNLGTATVKLPKGTVTNGLMLLTAHGGAAAATISINGSEPVVVAANQVTTAVVEAKWGKTLTVTSDVDVTVDVDVFAVVIAKGPGFNPLVVDLQASAPPAAGVPIGLDVAKAGVPATATAVLVQLTAQGTQADQLDLFTGDPDQHLNGVLLYGPGSPGSATVVARVNAEGKVVVHTTLPGTVTARLLGWYG